MQRCALQCVLWFNRVVRRGLMAALVVLVPTLAVAAPAAALPTKKPPLTMKAFDFGLEWALQQQGFVTPSVFYRLGDHDDILVVYAGGGSDNALEAIHRIESLVWAGERWRFDTLTIQNGDASPITVGYPDLQASLGPRPAGYDAASIKSVFAAAAAVGSVRGGDFSDFLRVFKIMTVAIGIVALGAVLTFGLGAVLYCRRRAADESEHRLFA
jgi:hypothetical protein